MLLFLGRRDQFLGVGWSQMILLPFFDLSHQLLFALNLQLYLVGLAIVVVFTIVIVIITIVIVLDIVTDRWNILGRQWLRHGMRG